MARPLKDLAHRILQSLGPDQIDVAWVERGKTREHAPQAPNREALHSQILREAVTPLHDPKLRELLTELKRKNEITIDHISADEILENGFSHDALTRAKGMIQSFEQFIKDHRDEIPAIQILYSKPYKHRLTFKAVKELADAIEKPPYIIAANRRIEPDDFNYAPFVQQGGLGRVHQLFGNGLVPIME